MKIIIPYWQGKVSPLFDAACTMLLVDMDKDRELGRTLTSLKCADPLQRVRQTMGFGADILICGAISGQLECMLQSTGLRIISNICGSVDDVLIAFAKNSLCTVPFLMPGCHGVRRRSRNRHGR